MLPCYAIRSFTILLIIKLAVESQVDAFTVRRVVESTFQPDLLVSESNSNQRDEAFKAIDITNVTQENNITVAPQEANNTNYVIENKTYKLENEITETPGIQVTEKIQNLTTSDVTVTTLSSNHTLDVALSTTTEEEIEGESTTVTDTSTERETSINSTLEDSSISTSESSNASKHTEIPVTGIQENGQSENYTQVNNSTNYTSNSSNSNEEVNTQQMDVTTKTETEVDNDSYSTRTVPPENVIESDISSMKIDDYSHPESSTDSSPESVSDNLIHDTSELNIVQETTTEQRNADAENTSFTNDYTSESLIPYWKKYTDIERKQLSSANQTEINTNSSETLVHAESGLYSPTTFSGLENTFTISSNIPALEKQPNELLSLTSESATAEPIPSSTDPVTASSPRETTLVTDFTTASQTISDLPRLDVVSSLRAGYLDYSSRTIREPETTTFERISAIAETEASVLNLSEKEVFTEVSSTESFSKAPSLLPVTTAAKPVTPLSEPESTPKNLETTLENINDMKITQEVQGLASQSQLAEDAINEELMKEEILIDNVEYSKRYRDGQFDVKALNNTDKFSANTPGINQLEDGSGDDKLSVKPISYEKKNISIYTVNPNYKPLKKLDVQPPKSFLRDPDDNSWRNESLSTLGIVFKAKNSSKAFTQVLKNKTEMQLNSISDTKSEEQSPELRTRLEKIAEKRKSKKKKTDLFGNTYYSDYEENMSNEHTTTRKNNVFDEIMSQFTTLGPEEPITEPPEINKINISINLGEFQPADTIKPAKTKSKKIIEEYDSDDDEVDYMHDIDLKKFKTKSNYVTPTAPFFKAISKTINRPTIEPQTTVKQFLPERKPTVQYFPPRERPKVIVNEYDEVEVNEFAFTKQRPSTMVNDMPSTTVHPTYVPWNRSFTRSPQQRTNSIWKNKSDVDKNNYVTHPTTIVQNSYTEEVHTDGYHRPSYLVKHLKDFINDVAKYDDAYATEAPFVGVTAINEERKRVKGKPPADYYDYEAQFRKDVLDRFVENFNQHSERFKVDFPILYNTSVVHSKLADESKGALASSSAFMKRLYEDTHALHGDSARKKFDPNCDKTIELSPAYELHYYVPEEEEKEVQEPRPANRPLYPQAQPYMLRL